MEYLAAHAGYTRVHNPRTGEKDLVRLPGLVAIAYQHETSRCGDPHLHTHVIVPNRQARADGQLVSIDGTSLYHEATRRRGDLSGHPAPRTAPLDGVRVGAGRSRRPGWPSWPGWTATTITAWSRRSTQLREWAAHNLTVVDAAGCRRRSWRPRRKPPARPNPKSWPGRSCWQQWRDDARGLRLDRAAFEAARAARRAAARTPFDRRRLADAAEKIEKAAFTRADLVEIVGAQLPVDTERSPAGAGRGRRRRDRRCG